MFSTKVKGCYSKLTMAEKKIADYLIVNAGEVGGVTSHELAERLGVGQSTVIRFSKKLGYRMFGELIADVESSSGVSSAEIGEEDTAYDVLEKLSMRYRDIVESVSRNNDGDCLGRAAEVLDGADTVVCYGYMNSHVFAEYLSESLIELGKRSICEVDIVQTKRRIQQLDPSRDVLVVISKSGDKAEPLNVAGYAASLGVPVLAISNEMANPLEKIANLHLKVLEISDRSTPLVSMGTAAGVMLVIDALVACVFQQDQKRYRKQYGNSLIVAFSERK